MRSVTLERCHPPGTFFIITDGGKEKARGKKDGNLSTKDFGSVRGMEACLSTDAKVPLFNNEEGEIRAVHPFLG